MIQLGPMSGPFMFWCAENFYACPFAACARDFEHLSQGIEAHAACHVDKRDAPLLFAGAFVDGAASKSAADLDATRLPPFALVDLDGASELTVAEVVARVAAALPGARCDVWTTHSHGAKGTRMRALIALTRGPASLDEHALVWAALNHSAGPLARLGPDQVTCDPTRGHALPSAPPGRALEYRRLPGLALDVDSLIAFARTLPVAPRSALACGRAERPAGVGLHRLTRDDLLSYMAHAKRLGKGTLPAAVAVLCGRSVAPRGQRYAALRDLLASLWHFVRREHGAWLDADSLWPLFEAPCRAMAAEGADVEPDAEWLAGLLAGYEAKGEARHQEALRGARELALAA